MTVAGLVERFVAIGLEQDKAELFGDTHRFNPLYREMAAVEDELKARSGDQRRALVALHIHPNMQVRWKAAEATLAIALEESRKTLREIRASRHHPQAADAGMTLNALDEGRYKPS
jgi:siderophore synthetase component